MIVTEKVQLVTGEDVNATSYRYKSKGSAWGNNATSGQVLVDMSDHRLLSFRVATLFSNSVGYRVEGKFGNNSDDRWVLFKLSISILTFLFSELTSFFRRPFISLST